MVNAPEKNLSPLPAGKYGESMKHSTRRRHHAYKGKSGLEEETVGALGALRNLQSKKRLAVEKRRDPHFFSNQGREKWIEDYVERETAVSRKPVHDPQTALMQEHEHMVNVKKGQSTTTKLEIPLKEMLKAIGDSLSDLASSKDKEDREDEDDDE